ncbi:biotin/lipoyl-binding protein [Sphingomonas aerolata]|uniref:biotin/lipoyl-binding protein n=1 Tax=Sphingomonas aerolata TaxID=185951 RepID=UPI002FE25F4E
MVVAGNRQTVQHREGGIVAAMAVRDGQHVRAGDVLFRLEGAEVTASERALAASVIDLQAQRARLEADVRGGEVVWPADFASAQGDDLRLVERAKSLQLAQRAARSAALAANGAVLRQQEATVAQQTTGFNAQAQATARQRASLRQQLDSTRALADQGYVSRNTVRADRTLDPAARRDRRRLCLTLGGRARTDRPDPREGVQTRRKYVEESATLLRDTQFQLNEVLPKLAAAREQLARTIIRAPVAGRVVGLRVFSVGA